MAKVLNLYGRILIATLGHVDHGKSTLIKTLTGIDPDRLPEEKVLEGTTDLGFAFFKALNGKLYGFIDLPGHRDYIKNLITGVLNAHFYILVVDAQEGIMPQTVEHIQIIKCLGMKYGMIVVSKIDMVEEVKAKEVLDEVKLLYQENDLEMVPSVLISFTKNIGVEELKKGLTESLEKMPKNINESGFVLPVMRTFSSHGSGTIVTGPVVQGRIGKGQTVFTINGKKSVIRNISIFKEKTDHAFSGITAALNVPDFEVDDVRRGTVLTDDANVTGTDNILILIHHSNAFKKYMDKKRISVVMFIFTYRCEAKMSFVKHFDGFSICKVKFPEQVPVFSLHKFICYSKDLKELLGAGEVFYTDVDDLEIKDFNVRFADTFDYIKYGNSRLFYLLNSVLSICGFLHIKKLHNLFNISSDALNAMVHSNCKEIQVFDNSVIINIEIFYSMIKKIIDAYHKNNPYDYGISLQNLSIEIGLEQEMIKSVLSDMINRQDIVEYNGLYHLPTFKILTNKKVDEPTIKLKNVFMENPFFTFSQDELLQFIPDEKILSVAFARLKAEQEIVYIGNNRWISKEGLDKIITLLRNNKDRFKSGFSPKDIKSLFSDLSRKHLIPILEYLDRISITKSIQDKRYLV